MGCARSLGGQYWLQFQTPRHVQRFLSTHDQIANVFSRPPLASATDIRSARTQAFTHWAEVTGAAMAA
jgi:putative transposase